MDALTSVTQADPAFRADVLAGLAAPIPAIPARWLYDRRGSELFEAITRLPEYYPTRTETALLELHSGDIAALVTCDAIHLLPGWQRSKGATLEHHIAERLGLEVFEPEAMRRAVTDWAAA